MMLSNRTPGTRGLLAAGPIRALCGLCALLLVAAAPAQAQRLVEARSGYGAGPGVTEAAERATGALLTLETRNPWIAAGLAYSFPGAGHVYAGEPDRALAILVTVGLGSMMLMGEGSEDGAAAGAVIAIGAYAWSIVDAHAAARRFNKRRAQRVPG